MNKFVFNGIKKLNIFMLWLLIVFIGSLTAFASENKITVSIDKQEYKTNESVVVKFNLNGDKKVSAFLIEAEYPEGLSYSACEQSSGLKSGYTDVYDNGSKVSFVYTFKNDNCLNPSENILTFKFKVSENIKGESEIKINIKGVLDENGQKLVGDSSGSLKFTANPPKEEVKLIKLVPSSGTLTPSFSSDVYKYKMYVPYSVDSITFDVEYEGEAKASVNRKNLGSGGSTSDFIITITPADGEKIIYTISVTRGEYVKPSSGNNTNADSSADNEDNVSENISESSPENSETSEIILEENTEPVDIIESAVQNESPDEKVNNTIVLEEPDKIETEEGNGFTAFLLGAGTMFLGAVIALLSVFIFKKIKNSK